VKKLDSHYQSPRPQIIILNRVFEILKIWAVKSPFMFLFVNSNQLVYHWETEVPEKNNQPLITTSSK